MIDLAALALKAAPAIGAEIAKIAWQETKKRINSDDCRKAWICGIETANKTYELFYPCEYGLVADFLQKLFTGAALPELQKPFNKQGMPEVKLLVAAFNKTVAENTRIQGRFMPENLDGWLEVFAKAVRSPGLSLQQLSIIMTLY